MKGLLVKFIYEARLIGFVDSTGKLHRQVINLNDSDLSHANLSGATISEDTLSYAYLMIANLSYANFSSTLQLHFLNSTIV